ncbi:N-acyl-D-amino-acid deacylase family protein [Nonomuraea sp. H19]|uniref:N-acyl-D-amino-acid deacylase family protein n=1 Tax=Nonomuraea sp. H19 TaxID=3452206 RepID=UPI003F8BDC9D
MSEFDALLRSGWIVDGSGQSPYPGDIGVRSGRIVAIGSLMGAVAAVDLNVRGKYVFPGFVDTHLHAVGALQSPETWAALLRQGVTTIILGQDGLGYAPAGADTVQYVRRYFGSVDGPPPTVLANGGTVADLLAECDRAVPVNVAYLVPAATVRHAVLGLSASASDGALAAMADVVRQGMDEGAVGLSSGLEYMPGAHADAAELAELTRVVAACGGVYVTHMRGYDNAAGQGVSEVRSIGAASHVGVHISHYHGPGRVLVDLADQARADGIDLTFDSYPYLRGSTLLAMALLPLRRQAGGPDATLAWLALPDAEQHVRQRVATEPALGQAILAHAANSEYGWAEGMTLIEAARRTDSDLAEFLILLLADCDLQVACVFAESGAITENDIRQVLRHEAHMGCSDGLYGGAHPHPRGFGAFARFLGRHVRHLGDWTWAQAAVHLASRPAQRFSLAGRGQIRNGWAADLAVVDPARVDDRSDYDRPRQLAVGVDHVLVAGVPVLIDGELTGRAPGRALRRGEWSP